MSKSSSRSSNDRSSGTEKKKKEERKVNTFGEPVRLETGGGRLGWEAPPAALEEKKAKGHQAPLCTPHPTTVLIIPPPCFSTET